MSTQASRAGLTTWLLAMSGGLGSGNTEFENLDYSPIEGQPYQRVALLPAKPLNQTIGSSNNIAQERGLFQIDLYYPLNKGPGDADAQAALIAARFKRGLSVTANQVTTIVDQTPEVRPGRREEDRWVVSIRVSYFANVLA
jgi:hypothetical protein